MNIEFRLALMLSEAVEATYSDLKSIDGHPKDAGWPIESVLAAVRPLVAKIAQLFHGDSPQQHAADDHIQVGLMRVWKLYNETFDKPGVKWGPYAVSAARNAMSELAITGGKLVPTTHRDPYDVKVMGRRPYKTGRRSGEYERFSDVPSDNPGTTKIRCPDCDGRKPAMKGCKTCKGKGRIVAPRERSSDDPAQEAEVKDWIEHNRNILKQLIEDGGLNPYQTEVLLLRYGAEGAYNDVVNSSDEPKQPTEVSRIIGYGRAIQELRENAIETSGARGSFAFDDAWSEVFGQYGYKFSEDTPVSLQISTMPEDDRKVAVERFRAVMERTIQINSTIGQPEQHTISKTAVQNRINKAMDRLHKAAGQE